MFLALTCGQALVFAQTSMNSSGGDAEFSGASVAYSLGQVFQNVNAGSSYTVIEGVQQSYEISQTLGDANVNILLDMNVYPNPTQDVLNLRVGYKDYKNYSFEIFDSSAKVLMKKSIVDSQTKVSIASYPAAVYYLKILKGSKAVKIFKIVKIDK